MIPNTPTKKIAPRGLCVSDFRKVILRIRTWNVSKRLSNIWCVGQYLRQDALWTSFSYPCFALIRSPPFTSNLIFPTSWKLQEKIPFVNAVSKTSPHKLLLHSLHLNCYACVSFLHSWKCFWDTLHVHELVVWLWECRVKNQKTLKSHLFPHRMHGYKSWMKSTVSYKVAFRSLKKQGNGISNESQLFKKRSYIFKMKISTLLNR